MTWRGSTDFKDRIFASLPYILPLLYVLPFGQYLLTQFPLLKIIYLPLTPLIPIFNFPFASLIIFFILFAGVVRNERISHFIRFNTMQAILIDIALFLISLVFSYVLAPIVGNGLIAETLYNVIFLGTLAACGYSMIQSWLGRYAEIPALSEAVYIQVR